MNNDTTTNTQANAPDEQELHRASGWKGYAVAVAVETLFLLLLGIIHGVLPLTQFPVFYALVTIPIAYAYGFGPWLLAFFISTVALVYYFIPPVQSIRIAAFTPNTWAGITAYLISSIAGVIVGLRLGRYNRSLVAEIAERKQAEDRLTELTSLLDQAHVLVRDPAGRITYWSTGDEHLYGFTKDEAIDRVTHELFQTVFPEPFEEFERKLFADGHWEGELVHSAKDGHKVVVASHQVLYRDKTGTPRAIIEANNDITELKRVEESLRESEESFRTMADAIPQLAWMAEPNGYIFWYNRRWYEYTGTTPDQMEGWGWQRVHDPDILPKVLERWQASIATGEPFDMEFPLLGADGEFRWFLTRVTPLKDQQGHVQRWFGTNTDVTEQIAAQEKVRVINQELEQRVAERTSELAATNVNLRAANKELEAFSYSVSHDLRAPLRAVDGFSSALQKSLGDELSANDADYLRRIRAAARRMGSLIDDLLGLSRASRAELKCEHFDLSAMVNNIVDELRRSQPEREAEFAIQPDVWVEADPHLMQIAMRNLLDNAWKFATPRDVTKIEFGALEQGGRRVYYVSDNGVGFDPTYVGKLFTPFQRLHTEAEFPGTGIGLALVQRIVHRHGGQVWAEGAVGEGAKFSFTLEAQA